MDFSAEFVPTQDISQTGKKKQGVVTLSTYDHFIVSLGISYLKQAINVNLGQLN